MGLPEQDVMGLVRTGVVLLSILASSSILSRDARARLVELEATTERGLGWLWRVRFSLCCVWSTIVLLIPVLSIGLRSEPRFGTAMTVLASMVDILFISTLASYGTIRTGSEASGFLTGIGALVAGILLGIRLPAFAPWLGLLTPISVYFHGAVPGLVVNRLAYGVLGLAVGWLHGPLLRSPTAFLRALE